MSTSRRRRARRSRHVRLMQRQRREKTTKTTKKEKNNNSDIQQIRQTNSTNKKRRRQSSSCHERANCVHRRTLRSRSEAQGHSSWADLERTRRCATPPWRVRRLWMDSRSGRTRSQRRIIRRRELRRTGALTRTNKTGLRSPSSRMFLRHSLQSKRCISRL